MLVARDVTDKIGVLLLAAETVVKLHYYCGCRIKEPADEPIYQDDNRVLK